MDHGRSHGDSGVKQLYKMIAGGRGVIPAFEGKLSEEEIFTVTTWLASLK